MIGMKIDEAKSQFFDREKVIAATTVAERRVLSRFGSFVRTRAISSMLGHAVRKGFGVKSKVTNREGASDPGKPPNPHTGLIVKFLFFVYEPQAHNVIIGPAKLNSPISDNALEVLEYGGTAKGLFLVPPTERDLHRRIERGLDASDAPILVRTQRKVQARPFMHPAFDEELKGLPEMWKDSIRA
jgi:hypothetical protein